MEKATSDNIRKSDVNSMDDEIVIDSDHESETTNRSNTTPGPTPSTTSNNIRTNVQKDNVKKNSYSSTLSKSIMRPKQQLTEWDVINHIKSSNDIDIPNLPIAYKEVPNKYQFYCLTKNTDDRQNAYDRMIKEFNNWRHKYNELHGIDTPVDSDIINIINISNQNNYPEEIGQEVTEQDNVIPNITDDNDFPTLGGGSSKKVNNKSYEKYSNNNSNSQRSNNYIDNKSKMEHDTIDIDDDPNDEDFIQTSQTAVKKSKKTLYKPLQQETATTTKSGISQQGSYNIFDFDNNKTIWNDKKKETNYRQNNRSLTPPEQQIPCPICNKLFRISKIETHASDCGDVIEEPPALRISGNITSRRNLADDGILISDNSNNASKSEQSSSSSSKLQVSSDNTRTGHPNPNKRRTLDMTESRNKKLCNSKSPKS